MKANMSEILLSGKLMEREKMVYFEDLLPVMARKLGGEGLIRELCNGFEVLMDRDKDLITVESLMKKATVLGLQDFKEEEVRSMVKEGDLDGDGALNRTEFCVLMFRLSPQLMDVAERRFDHGF